MSPDILVHPDKTSRLKIMRSIANTGYLNVWEGAVRSSKTVVALIAFAVYVTRSPETTFLLSGRTVGTIETNCILDDYGLLNLLGLPSSAYHNVGNTRAITFSVQGPDGRLIEKKIRVYGASDIQSYMAIRGNTYGGWFADEINLHNKQFVEEALNRTSVSIDRKHFWTLNPDNPRHWVYTEYLDYYSTMPKGERKRLGGYHWWHFTPKDNPAMTPAMYQSLCLQYPKDSYLYQRYVLGLRCIAEGLVYPEITDQYFRTFSVEELSKIRIRYCAIDFGANHPTVMVFGGMYYGNSQDWRIVKEYFDEKSNKTTYDHYVQFLNICKELGADPNKVSIAIDPSALSLRVEFINHGLNVIKAKNDVLPGIEFIRRAVTKGNLTFSSTLTHAKEEFGTYSWDEKACLRGEDKVIKEGDDVMDAIRYFGYTFMRPFLKW